MSKEEAMKRVLEALERYQVKRQDFDRFADEITALREALAEQDDPDLQDKAPELVEQHYKQVVEGVRKVFDAKRKQSAQQEPVALPCCGYTDASAIKWNPYNQVVQCHNCGQVYTTPQPAQQEPVACSVCDQVHSILDGDESKIIRNAKDGYPEGRSPRILTLQERVMALSRYASDWKRWCLEKENTTPPAQRTWVGLNLSDREKLRDRFEGWSYPAILVDAVSDILKEKNT